MADPISFLAAGVGIADVAFRVIVYLNDVKTATENIDDDIGDLINEMEGLVVVHGQLEQDFLKNVNNDDLGEKERMLWFKTGQILQCVQKLTQKFETSVKQIYGDSRKATGLRDGLSKQHRKRSRDPIITRFRDQISSYHGVLQMWLACITMHSSREDREKQETQLEQLGATVKSLEDKLAQPPSYPGPTSETMVATVAYNEFAMVSSHVLNQIGASINGLSKNLTRTTPIRNEHFDTPKPVDQFYTGRADQAEQLSEWFFPRTSQSQGKSLNKAPQRQKRFVIYGIGGSGKTQFCCKFAEDNRDHFWGVFWVDGSSQSRLRQTFSQNVSTIADVDANEHAALHWLSSLTKPWLLIIDNADDPDLKLDDYLPRGNRGHILITTRNSLNKHLGTVGNKFFEFQGMRNSEASCLLLTAAGQVQPWDSTMSHIATTIARTLGYLALAITHAGRAIREGYCMLHEYLDFHERQWKKMRQKRASIKDKDEADDLGVFATFELNRRVIEDRDSEASRDALQLLDTFAFLHNQNIRFDILTRAITNAQVESKHAEEEKNKTVVAQADSALDWSVWWSGAKVAVITFIWKNRTPSVLPDVIRRGRESKELDIYRLRAALVELTQFSLVTHTEKTDSYSMHALVHKWARERPGMSVTEQAVWVHAATELLSHCILLPPLGNTTEDERIRKYLLPHIDHVSECQSSIDQRMRDKRIARMKPWPIFEGTFNRDKALTYAKFSTVYAQHGLWDKAKRLQSAVKDFTTQVLGVENPVTRRIMLALSGTLFNLGQSDDAAALQEQVLEACMLHKGPDHYETYAAKRTLGECRRLQGRITDATKLLEEAVAGLSRHHGDHHEETLNAIDSLAQTVSMFYTEESTKRSRELHGMAVDGLKKILGQDHLRALMAMENWCINEVQSSDKTHLKDAHDMMVVVFEARKEKLGREHAYTLLAMVNIARVKVGLGDLKEAEELMLFGLPIAARNLGVGHQGYLWGRYILGQILVRQKRWEEAEQLLSDVTQRQCGLLQGRGKYHPDRLGALVELAVVYDALGKVKECDEVADEALEGFARISTSEHPVARKLREDRIKWNERRLQENGDQSVSV